MDNNDKRTKEHYKQQRDSVFRYLGLITQLALTMIVCILGFFFLGLWIGEKTGFQILFMVGGLIIGIGSGFYFCYLQISGLEKNGRK